MRLVHTMLDSTRRAKWGIPRDVEGEGKRLKTGNSAFRSNVNVMAQVWNDRTCANDKHEL